MSECKVKYLNSIIVQKVLGAADFSNVMQLTFRIGTTSRQSKNKKVRDEFVHASQ